MTQKLPEEAYTRTRQLLEMYEEELKALLAFCNARETRDEGIPAILIVDDFTRAEKPMMTPALADELFGPFYADLALALAVLVEAGGGDPDYPSICPAMSAIAEQAFVSLPYSSSNPVIDGGNA